MIEVNAPVMAEHVMNCKVFKEVQDKEKYQSKLSENLLFPKDSLLTT